MVQNFNTCRKTRAQARSSKSGSKIYINFENFEGKNHEYFKNTLIHKAKQFVLTTKNSGEVYIRCMQCASKYIGHVVTKQFK